MGNAENHTSTKSIYFQHTLPFSPNSSQIIYIEDTYHDEINRLIQENFELISNWCRKVHHEFCYFPRLSRELTRKDYIQYYAPGLAPSARLNILSSNCLAPYTKNGQKLFPALIYYTDNSSPNEADESYYKFTALPIETFDHATALDHIKEFITDSYKSNDTVELYCVTTDIEDYIDETLDDRLADEKFPQEVESLLDEVRKHIDRLRQYGVGEMVIQQLLQPTNQKISRLKITADYQIILTDYNDRIIKMTPLVKSVFFLFLRHPEGIVFKYLPDYRNELSDIYNRVTAGCLSPGQLKERIENVTDPRNNSINEKCARIREAFLREINETLAAHYFVTGERGTAKRISLPRELITIENQTRSTE